MANGDIPAGWYPDPSGTGGERWWDGMGWTQHARAQGAAPGSPQPHQPQQPVAQPQQPQQPQVPAGWYPDPSGTGGQRWWDGAQWTGHVQPATPIQADPQQQQPQQPQQPVAQPQQPQQPQVPAGWYPDPSGTGGQRWWDGAQWTEHVHAAVVDAPAERPVSEGAATEATTAGDQTDEPMAGPAIEEGRGPEGATEDPSAEGATDDRMSEGSRSDPGREDAAEVGASQAAGGPGTAQPEIPAGWYPDPAGGGGQRWWDGLAWSDEVQPPRGDEGVDADAGSSEEPAASASGEGLVPTGDAGLESPEELDPTSDADPSVTQPTPDPDGSGGATDPVSGTPEDEVPPAMDPESRAEHASDFVGSDGAIDPGDSDGEASEGSTAWPGHAAGAGALGAGAAGVGVGMSGGEESQELDPAATGDFADETPSTPDEPSTFASPDAGADSGTGDDPSTGDEASGDEAVVDQTAGGQASAEFVATDAVEADGPGATQEVQAAGTAAGAIPAGWYADPSGQGERWWTGDSWSEHVRTPPAAPGDSGAGGADDESANEPAAPEAQPAESEPTEAISPVDPATGSTGLAGVTDAPGSTVGAGSVAPQEDRHGGFTMSGVGAVPPTGPPPDGDDDGGGGSRKLIVIVLVVVLLLAAVGAALWFFTDVFDQAEPIPAAADESEETEEVTVEEEPEEEPEPTFVSVRDADLAVVDWSTTCIGTEASPNSRASQPQSVAFDDPTATVLWHDNPHDPSGLPAYSVDLGSVQYGDATGDGNEDAVVITSCEDVGAADTGLEVWSLDGEGRPFQQPTPPIELTSGQVHLASFDVDDGRVVVTVGEVQDDNTELEVVTEYVLSGSSWTPNELEREEPPVAIEDDQIPGITFDEFGPLWTFELRPTAQAPLIATHEEIPSTFIIALDESLLGLAGPDLEFEELSAEWMEALEIGAEEEDVELSDDWFSDVEVEGAENAVQAIYEGPSAEVNYYLLIAEVGDLVVEVSVQLEQEGWVEEEMVEDVLFLFSTFTFDPDVLMAAYEEG